MGIKYGMGDSAKAVLCVILLFSITFVVFEHTVEIREPWFGELSNNNHQWLTGSILKYSKNWYLEGPLNLKFAMLENPRSIEFPTISSRDPYTSYPPGTVFSIYFASEIVGHEPTTALVMDYDLLNHFLIAFFLSIMIFFFLRQLKIDYLNSFFFSIIPIFMELLLPAPLYWHQNVFFADQAVILLFVLYTFLEISRDNINNRYLFKFLNIIQNVVLFYGFLTDWLFVFIALTVYIKRIIDGEIVLSKKIYPFIKGSLFYWFAPLLALFLFAIQLYILGTIGHTLSEALIRTGMSQNITVVGYSQNGLNMFMGYFDMGYGPIAVSALLVSIYTFILISILAYYRSYKQKINYNVENVKKILYLIGILLFPCILQVLVFSNHSILHDFSVLKFSLSFATVPLVFLPLLVFFMFENSFFKNFSYELSIFKRFNIDFRLFIIFLIVFAASSSYVAYENPNYKNFFPQSIVILRL